MTLHRAPSRQQGFSMLEVLIAVLVFSLGMIGLAGLLIFAISSNHVAYLRTQATFLAHNMANRMSANPAAVWAGNYNINAVLAPGTGITMTCAAGCSPADLATRDIQVWSQQLNTFLPNVKGAINCSAANLTYQPTPAQIANRPPYGGTCQMVLQWNEASSGSNGNQQPNTFAWTFQP
jgi:type IV pilus assembly protein PilV